MRTEDFEYSLPLERIAQTPVEPRHNSRLLVMERGGGGLVHEHFYNIPNFLRAGDLLVLNETRVIPARIFAHKPTGGKVELLLLKRLESQRWEALIGGKHVRAGQALTLGDGSLARIEEVLDGSRRIVSFDRPVETYLHSSGQMPLPPYIHTRLQDPERYQTVYAAVDGSAAAPTAGLHFTPELLARLASMGVETARVLLHVGLDTFAPVHEDDPREHVIHSEWREVSGETAEKINRARKEGRRVIAVGTTSVRTLESAWDEKLGAVAPVSGPTSLFILPGYTFRVVDGMVTNFHLPKSTLLMLVSAFAGRERILAAYAEAVRLEYRFFSFGDAMLIA